MIYGFLLPALFSVAPALAQAREAGEPPARRIAFTFNIAAAEYAKGFEGGKLVKPEEAQEADGLLKWAHGELDKAIAAEKLEEFDTADLRSAVAELEKLAAERAQPRSFRAAADRAVVALGRTFGVSTLARPEKAPSIERGRAVYADRCAMCHGANGDGKGPAAPGLKTEPFSFAAPDALRGQTPTHLWEVVTMGVPGTAMISWADALSEQERWDAVAALWTFAAGPWERERGRAVLEKLGAKAPKAFSKADYWLDTRDSEAVRALLDAAPGLSEADARAAVAFKRLEPRP